MWTFTIRHGVTWQDGVPLTARDVAFTINLIVKNQNPTWITYVQNVKKAVASTPYHVSLVCKAPTPSMLDNLAEVPILPQHIWSKIPAKQAFNTFPNKPPIIGSGPFQCVEWMKSGYIVMKANKNYWRGPAHVDQVVFENFTNADTMARGDEGRDLDACSGLLQAQMRMLSSVPGVTTQAVHVNGYDELGFNCYTGGPSLGNPVLKDWRFRQALQWAIDKATLCSIAYGGMAKPADTVVTANYYKNPDWHWTPPAVRGLPLRFGQGRPDAHRGGLPAQERGPARQAGQAHHLAPLRPQRVPAGHHLRQVHHHLVRQLGLKVQLSIVDDGALEDALYNTVKGTFTPDYDMFLWGWYNDIDPGIELDYFTTSQIDNWSDCAWSNPRLRPALEGTVHRDGPGQAPADDRRAAADDLRADAVHPAGLLGRHRGLEHQPLDRLGRVAGQGGQRRHPTLWL